MEKVAMQTERLVLRAPSLAEVDAITAACQDPEIQRRVPIPVPYTQREAEGYVTTYSDAGWADGTKCTWAIMFGDDFAGAISLDGIGSEKAELGYWMVASFRGRGLLTEAAHAVVDFGFAKSPDGLGLERIEWRAYAGNVASASVARRIGFSFEGTLRLGARGRLAREDIWMAGLLAGDSRIPRSWAVLS